MSDAPIETTVASFPTYAELTQTEAWGRGPRRVQASLDEATDAADRSSGGRYAEGAVLGVGGMGKVVLARDARIGRDVAVKVLHGELELSEAERARFLREAQVQGQLEHPSIVPVYDIDRRDDGTTFFTMRRVLGRTLASILHDLRTGGAAPSWHRQRELLGGFATVCLTLEYAHRRGVVHRDVKPANIMLGDFGEVYVLDWGLARLIDERGESTEEPAERLSMPGALLGTPLYMAPEQMADPDVGPTADVFALGAILFEILTLERLRDPRAVFVPPETRPSVRAPDLEIAPELETICVRATAADPAERYASARELHDALARYLDGDRELAQRRQLAEVHGAAARQALARAAELGTDPEEARGEAMRELLRAIALDPTVEHVGTLAELMASPPREVPAEVAAEQRKATAVVIRGGARYAALAMLSWFVFFPVVLAIGIARPLELAWIAAPAAIAVVMSVLVARQRDAAQWPQLVAGAAMAVAGMGLSRLYGPFILGPTMLATAAIVFQAHPARVFRRVASASAVIAMVLPAVLEATGVAPASYAFEGGRWLVLPRAIELPRGGTIAMLLVANVAILVLPALFVGRLRGQLLAAELQQRVQSWHFRRLGAELISARRPG